MHTGSALSDLSGPQSPVGSLSGVFRHAASRDSWTLKFLTLVDEFTRECLAINVERRLPAKAVIEVLEQVFAERGMPEYLRSDNGPEFIAKAVQRWLKERR